MGKDEEGNNPFQYSKNQERANVDRDREQYGVHDVESQMEHDRKQDAVFPVIEEPCDVEREGQHEQEI